MNLVEITTAGSPIEGQCADSVQGPTLPYALSRLQAAAGGVPRPRGAYLHVPFCFHKCHYCDFYSFVDTRGLQEPFTDRLIEEIRATAALVTAPLETIFVGGGTPTLLAAEAWARILAAIRDAWPLASDLEFTVEANPETVTAELAAALVAGGVDRVSVGAQSFDRRHLATLERHHEPANVGRSVEILRDAGIGRINLDLILGIPGQSLADWASDLEIALDLGPDHLSCYGLTYEPNTAMTVRMQRGDFEPTADDLEAAMDELAHDRLAAAGFERYEISNWAMPGERCRHNLLYWTNADWLALGPSASGHLGGLRWKNRPRITEYLEHRPWPTIEQVERVDDDARVGEILMLGLRLLEGIERERLAELLALGERGGERRAAIERHLAGGLLAWTGEGVTDRLRLTDAGRLLANDVLADLV